MIDYNHLVKGEELKCIVRVKPATNFQSEDLKILGNSIHITNQDHRRIFVATIYF